MKTIRGLMLIAPRAKPKLILIANVLTYLLGYALVMDAALSAFVLAAAQFDEPARPLLDILQIIAMSSLAFGAVGVLVAPPPVTTKLLLSPPQLRRMRAKLKQDAIKRKLAKLQAKDRASEAELIKRGELREGFLGVAEGLAQTYGMGPLHGAVIAHEVLEQLELKSAQQ